MLRFSAVTLGSLLAFGSLATPADQPSPDAVIAAARKTAAAFAHAAPSYIAKRTIYRYRGVRPAWTATAAAISQWQSIDTISGNLTVSHDQESYTNLTVNGFPAQTMPSGISTAGELSTEPLMILAPAAAAVFSHPESDTIRKHHTYRYDFSVDQPHSTWYLDLNGGGFAPPFAGRIWIDRKTGEVVRIEAHTTSIPKGFPLDWAQLKTDYNSMRIGGKNYMLPTESGFWGCMSQPEKIHDFACYWNDSFFREYRRFSVDSDLIHNFLSPPRMAR